MHGTALNVQNILLDKTLGIGLEIFSSGHEVNAMTRTCGVLALQRIGQCVVMLCCRNCFYHEGGNLPCVSSIF